MCCHLIDRGQFSNWNDSKQFFFTMENILRFFDFVYFQGPLWACLNPVSCGEDQVISCISRLFFGPIPHPECCFLNLNLVSRKISKPIPSPGRQKRSYPAFRKTPLGAPFQKNSTLFPRIMVHSLKYKTTHFLI